MIHALAYTPNEQLCELHSNNSAIESKTKPLPATAVTVQGNYISVYDNTPTYSMDIVLEHYMPYEFPICPVITSNSQRLVVDSWCKIVKTSYESEDTASGKISGATYFYNQFFDQLFARLRDFERIFPNIKARADIISHVMAMITSVRAENLDYLKLRLRALGKIISSRSYSISFLSSASLSSCY